MMADVLIAVNINNIDVDLANHLHQIWQRFLLKVNRKQLNLRG